MPHTVLLIDDSPTISQILKIYLMGQPLEFLEAPTAERGLQLLKLMKVSLVIADIRMPGMDGIEFTKHLRQDARPQVRNLPVILLTGEKTDDLRTQALQAGANAFLTKPVSAEALKKAVESLLPKPP